MSDLTTTQERIAEMEAFAARQGWGFATWTGTQRDPGDGVRITIAPGIFLSVTSHDGLHIAVARMEAMLLKLRQAANDVYLDSPHGQMGGL